VLAQDYVPFEIIVVDGGSVDSTAAIAKSYGCVRWIEQMGQGLADAYNVGIASAQGELIAFLSHDDLWTPNKLSVQVDYLQRHPEAQYVIAHVHYFLEPGFNRPPGFRQELLVGSRVGLMMETVLARKSCFDWIGTFDPRYSSSEDADWFVRASDLQIGRGVVAEVLLHKRIHNANLTFTDPEGYRNMLRILKNSIERKRIVR
jgi:glycosyltransferase involved in cell wall biosynthesis